MGNRLLMVVIAIGDEYNTRYRQLFWPSHKRYCDLHGYDLLVINSFIDSCEKDPSLTSLQKALVCSLPQAATYTHVASIDADILINTAIAPPLLEAFNESQKIAIVDEASQPTRELHAKIVEHKGWESSPSEYYRMSGFDLTTPHLLNTGLYIAQPLRHRSFFERIYAQGKANGRGHPRGFHYEQSLIGYHLQGDAIFELLDNRWNAIFGLYLKSLSFGRFGVLSRSLLNLSSFRSRVLNDFFL